jgi:hypothetical protein
MRMTAAVTSASPVVNRRVHAIVLGEQHDVGRAKRGVSVVLDALLTLVLLTSLGFSIYELVWLAREKRWALFAVLLLFGVVTGVGWLVSGARGMYRVWTRARTDN